MSPTPSPSPSSTRTSLQLAVSFAVACALALLHLGLHPDLPWLAEEPEELSACALPDELAAPGIDVDGVDDQVPLLPTISTTEALGLVGADGVTFVDARDLASFRAGHIPEALCLPAAEAPELLGQASLPIAASDRIITYCGEAPEDAELVGVLLQEHLECEDVTVLRGGWPQWLADGGPSAGEPGHG